MKAQIFLVNSIKGLIIASENFAKENDHFIITTDDVAMKDGFIDEFDRLEKDTTRLYSFATFEKQDLLDFLETLIKQGYENFEVRTPYEETNL